MNQLRYEPITPGGNFTDLFRPGGNFTDLFTPSQARGGQKGGVPPARHAEARRGVGEDYFGGSYLKHKVFEDHNLHMVHPAPPPLI